MSRHNGLPGYDAWKTRSPDDEYCYDEDFVCPLSGDPCPYDGEECDEGCVRELLSADKVTVCP
jgi:hypothetical protein